MYIKQFKNVIFLEKYYVFVFIIWNVIIIMLESTNDVSRSISLTFRIINVLAIFIQVSIRL